MPKLTLTFKGRVMDVFHLEDAVTRIGRDPECTISIDSLAIAPHQVTISTLQDGYLLEAQDAEFPVLVNHEPTEKTPLYHGDVIQVGKHTLTFSEDALELGNLMEEPFPQFHPVEDSDEDDEDDLANKGMLQIVNGEHFGRIIPLKRNMTRIGHTGGDCAMIARREEGYFISFLEGDHPPVVNNQRLGEHALQLNDGDLIEVGGTQMQFHA
ncbi:MAG: FHA domain-containing protein [Candidatus Thiodiazotropha sp.]